MGEVKTMAAGWVERLRNAAKRALRPLAFMEVCGTHTVQAFRCALGSLLPANVRLISGPGCPVCVTSQGDLDLLIQLAQRRPALGSKGGRITLCTYGDMLRVKGTRGSLEQARGQGADVRVVTSAMEAIKLAAASPSQQVVFAGVGFETTAPATALTILEAKRRGLDNYSVLASHKRILPAMQALLESGRAAIDGFLCPGHVSVILGHDAYASIARRWGIACVVAGFEDVQIIAGVARLAELACERRGVVENLYPEAVRAGGNRTAQGLLEQVFEPVDATWRALGKMAQSGLGIREAYRPLDAFYKFDLKAEEAREPEGCRCGDVMTGRCTPDECRLFGKACTPSDAIGPCMVSSEGVCQAWFKYARHGRKRLASGRAAAEASA